MFDLEITEKKIMNLFGLITAIKSSSENLSLDDDAENIEKHRECVMELCDIADEKLKAVWKDVSDIEQPQDNMYSLAELLTEVLDYPQVPSEIYEAVRQGVHTVAEKTNFKSLEAVEISEKYISDVLRDYEEVRNRDEQ